MRTSQTRPPSRLLFLTGHRQGFTEIDCGSHDTLRARLEQRQFETMSLAFRPHGGFVSADDVTRRLRWLPDQPLSTLERWLASRKALIIWWRNQTLMPMFQFDLEKMAIKQGCARAIDELKAVFDDWELALWFATPNAWLAYATPVTLFASDKYAVLQAARADRFISRG